MLPNSKKHNVFKMASRNKILLAILVVLAIAAAVLAEVKINFKENSGEEKTQAFSYNYFYDGQQYCSETNNVAFSAYFMKDINNTGTVSKVLSSWTEIGESDTLYMKVNVYNEGYLKNGKIQINGKNFYLATNIYKDDEIKDNYISANTKKIEFNNISSGTSKSLEAEVRSGDYYSVATQKDAIGEDRDNFTNYSTIVFTGTYVDGEGNETALRKEYNVDVNWYGSLNAVINNTDQKYSNLSSIIDEQNDCIKFKFNVSTEETNKQLAIIENDVRIYIPKFNGYDPIDANCLSNVTDSEYVTDNNFDIQGEYQNFDVAACLYIDRDAQFSDEGKIENESKMVSEVSNINSYEIEVIYPLEAYKKSINNVINLNFLAETEYYAINNYRINSYDSSDTVQSLINVTYENIETVNESDIGIEIGKNISNNNIVSKKDILSVYYGNDAIDTDMEYTVTWKASIDESSLNKKIVMSDNGKADEFIKTDLSRESIEDLVSYYAIQVENADKVLGDDGWINVYDSDKNDLIATLTKDDWKSEHYYDVFAKHIRIETSEVISNSRALYITNIKNVNVKAIVKKYDESDFNKFVKISSTVIGNIGDKTINSKEAIAEFEEPINSLEANISDTEILVDGNEKNIILTLKTTEDEYMNKSALINAAYLIKLPEKFKEVNIDAVNLDSYYVWTPSWEVVEKDGTKFVRVITQNSSAINGNTYTLEIHMTVAIDTEQSINEFLDVYYSTDGIGQYENTVADAYDINLNANTNEYVGKDEVAIKLNYEESVVVSQKIDNMIAPLIAEVSPNYEDNDKNVKINIDVKNNDTSDITNVKVLGRIPYEGNQYPVSKVDMGSEFSTNLTDDGIIVPDELKNKVNVYYSENIDANAEVVNEENNWIKADEVENMENMKSYLIDFENTAILPNCTYSFEYNVNIPGVDSLNQTSYAGVSVYYSKNVNNEKQKSQIDGNKLGVRLVEKFDVELIKCQDGSDIVVSDTTYGFLADGKSILKSTDQNGMIHLNLYAGLDYDIYELFANSNYEINNKSVWFNVDVDDEGNLELGDVSSDEIFEFDANSRKLNISLKDTLKGNITLNLVEKDTNTPISDAEFKIGEKYYMTDSTGNLNVKGLEKNKEYTIEEISADGYYTVDKIKFKAIEVNGNYSIEIMNGSVKSSSINNDNGLTAVFNIENEKAKKFNLQITAIDETDDINDESTYKYLPNVEFGLYEDYRLIGTYTTDENGKITIPDLYEYAEGQKNPEYILRERVVPDGYSKLENMTIYARRDEDGNLGFYGVGRDFYYNVDESNINLILENYKYNKLINKDEKTQNTISGSKFMIIDAYTNEMAVKSDGTYWGHKENINGEDIYVETTDENGEILLDLPEGQYNIIQVQADEKYDLADATEFVLIGLKNIQLLELGTVEKNVIFYSTLKKFDINISINSVDADAGTISNALEKVEYDSSSVDEHKVTPKEGYEIISVLINDVEQDFTLNDDGSYTIPIFDNVHEDKNIVVEIMNSNKKLTVKTIDAETKTPVEGVEIACVSSIAEDLINNGNYYFVKNDSGEYIPTNGKTYRKANGINSGVQNSVANSYLLIDLTKEKTNKKVAVTARCDSENGFDYGYATITNTTTAPSYTSSSGRFMYVSGNVEEQEYVSQTLYAGNKYYLHIGYRKDGSADDGEDQVVIENIYLLDSETSNLTREKNVTNKLGEINYQLDYNTYRFSISKLPDGYTIDNKVLLVNNTVDSDKEITFELRKLRKVIVHHYLEGTTTKIADDDILYGEIGTKYLAKAKIDSYGYELIKDDNENYVLPDNYTGLYTSDDQEVAFYYKENKVEVVVHHYIEGTNLPVPLADGSSATDEKDEYNVGDEYQTSAISEDELDKNYRVSKVEGNTSGIVQRKYTEITYYYARPSQTLTINKYAEDGKTPLENAEFSIVSQAEYDNPIEPGEIFRGLKIQESPPQEMSIGLKNNELQLESMSLLSNDQYSDFYFVKDGDRYISNNRAKGTYAIGYIRIDLTNATSKKLTINAELLGTSDINHANICVWDSEYSDQSDEYDIYDNGAKDYTFELYTGHAYYIEFRYFKESYDTPDYEDAFAINSMKLENLNKIVTDKNGKAQVSLPAGDYVLIEDKAPRGYEKLEEPVKIQIGKDSGVTQDIIDEKASGRVIVHYYAEGTTDKVAEDKIITGKIGTYYDTESTSDLGESYELAYVPENKYGNIQIDDIEVIYYYRVKSFDLTITKTQKDSDIRIEGVKYELIDGNEIAVYITDENGQFSVLGLKQGTEYELVEVSAPEGYSLDRKKLKFKLIYEDGKLICKNENGDLNVEPQIIYEDTPRLELNIQNEPLFELTKTSEDGVKLLPGAKFVIKELVDNDGTTVENEAVDYAGNVVGVEEEIDGQVLRVVTTDENGKIGIALKNGKYKITEVQAPAGYKIGDDNTQYFEITEDTVKDINFDEIFYHDALSGVDIDNGYVKLKDGSYVSIGGFYDELGIPGQRIDESGELVQVTVDGEDIWLTSDNYPKHTPPPPIDEEEEEDYDSQDQYYEYKAGTKMGYIMKINAEGKVESARAWGSGNYFHITDIIATSDGGFTIAGEKQGYMEWYDNSLNINSYSYNNGSFVAKFSSDGSCEWTTTINNYSAYIYNYQVLEDNNGDYLVYGFTNKDITINAYDTVSGNAPINLTGNESYLLKIEKLTGKVYWGTSIAGECYGKIVKSEDDYLIHVIWEGVMTRPSRPPRSGNVSSEGVEYSNEYVLRVSNSGIIKSAVSYNYVDFSDEFEYVTEQTAKDGGRLIIGNIRESFTIPAGSTTSGKDINVKVFGKVTGVVLKTNMNGKVEWVRTLASDECENMFLQVAPTENNGCIVAGMFAGKLDVVYYDGDIPYVKTYETEKHAINLVFLNYDSNGAILNVDGSRMIRYDGTYEDDDETDISVEDKFTEGVLAEYPIDFDVNSINDLGDGYYEVCLMGYEYAFEPIWNDDTLIDPPGYYSTGKLVRNIVYKAVETPAKVAEKQDIKMKNTAKSFTIKTRVEGDGGMITGEDQPVFEIVNEGEDSKKVIKIMPDKLHYIKKITINGVEIDFEINEEDGTYILKGFTNMDEDKEIVVTFGTYDSEIIVHHYKEGTTEKLHDDVIIKGGEGEQYTTEPIQELLEKYDLVSTPDNATGEFIKGQTEIFYYYRLKDTDDNVKIVVKYLDKSSGNEVADSETITGIKGDEYTTKEKEVDGFKLKEVPENAKGTMTEDIEVIYYYLRPAKVIVNYIDTETGDELAEPEIIEGYQDDEYTTEEKKFDYYKLIKSPTNAKGTMEVKVSKDEDGEEVIEDEINVDYYYNKQTFNLKIKKDVSSAIVNGVSNDMYNGLSKIEIARKAVNSTNIQVVYKITVINDGDLTGKGTIQEQIPAGMEFVADANSEWKVDGKVATLETKELAAGEQAEYTVTMNWTKSSENIGTKRNTVKIISTENEAGFEEKDTKDNTAYADIVIAISTGANSYMNIAGGVLLVMIALACGVYVVKKVDEE